MRIATALSFVIVCSTAFGQDPTPTVKGHRIGEDFLDYLITAQGSREAAQWKLTDCGTFLQDPKTQKRYSRAPLLPNDEDKRFRSRVDECMKQGDALTGKLTLFVDGLESYLFSEKRLVVIKLQRVDSFDKVVHDVSEKFGPPDLTELVQFQNGFGAVFTHPQASWNKRSDVLIVASESAIAVDLPGNAPKIYPVSVLIEDRNYAAKTVSEENKKPNSLD